MKLSRIHEKSRGLTIIEVIVVLAIIIILGLLLIPVPPRRGSELITKCMSNLKQIGLAEVIWSQDYTNGFPAIVSTNNSGTREYLQNGRVDMHFQALAPYLGPQSHVVCCPADNRKPPVDFVCLKNTNISYFVSLDSTSSNSVPIAAGDSNLEIDGRAVRSSVAAWAATNTVTWDSGRHKGAGNLIGNFLFADGHAERFFQTSLPKLAQQLGTNVNRLAFP